MFCPLCYTFFPIVFSKLVDRESKSKRHDSKGNRNNKNEKCDRENVNQHNFGISAVNLRLLLYNPRHDPSCAAKNKQKSEDFAADLKSAISVFEQKFGKSLDGVQAKLSGVAKQSPVDNHFSDVHKRLDSLEQQIHERLSDSVVKQLILLHDLVASQEPSESSPLANAVRNEILEMLRNAGIEAFSVESDDFDSSRQRCIGFQETDSRNLDGKTARRDRTGFRNDNRIVRHEEVTLFRAEPKTSLTP